MRGGSNEGEEWVEEDGGMEKGGEGSNKQWREKGVKGRDGGWWDGRMEEGRDGGREGWRKEGDGGMKGGV